MVQVTLDDQQAKIVAEAQDIVEVRDHAGRVLGYVTHGFSAEEISLAQQRAGSPQPRFTTQQVLRHLEAREKR